MKSDMLEQGIFFLTSQFRISLQSWSSARRLWMTHSMSKTGLEWIMMKWAIDLEIASLWIERSMIRLCSVPFIRSLDTTMSSFLLPPVQAKSFQGCFDDKVSRILTEFCHWTERTHQWVEQWFCPYTGIVSLISLICSKLHLDNHGWWSVHFGCLWLF